MAQEEVELNTSVTKSTLSLISYGDGWYIDDPLKLIFTKLDNPCVFIFIIDIHAKCILNERWCLQSSLSFLQWNRPHSRHRHSIQRPYLGRNLLLHQCWSVQMNCTSLTYKRTLSAKKKKMSIQLIFIVHTNTILFMMMLDTYVVAHVFCQWCC